MENCRVSPGLLVLALVSGGASAGAIYFIYFILTQMIGASGILFFFIPLTACMVLCFFYLLFCGWWTCDGSDPGEQRPLV